MWENIVTPETHDPIAIGSSIIEQSNKIDGTQGYTEQLNELVTAWRANWNMYIKISKSEGSIQKRTLNFVGGAPKYSGNPEKVSEMCKNLKLYCLTMVV